jgi:hypothetical protein
MSNTPDNDPLLRLEELAKIIPGAKKGHELGAALERALEAARGIEPQIQKLDELYQFILFFEDSIEEYDRAILADKFSELCLIGEETEQAANIEQLNEIRVKLRDVVPTGVGTVERRLSEAWQKLIQAEFSTVGSLGEVLNKIRETAQLGRELAATHREAKLLASVLPSSTKKQKQYNELLKKREALLGRLKKLGAGPEVIAFLIAVANQDATLAHATADVNEWLGSRDALSEFRIGLVPPNQGS